MIRVSSLALGFTVFSVAASAFAQDEAAAGGEATASTGPASGSSGADRKFKLGLRSGYALPMGGVQGAQSIGTQSYPEIKVSDAVSGQIPIWIDAGYMVLPEVLVGAYFQYGIVQVKKATTALAPGCAPGDNCSAHDIRFGVQAQYHFSPAQSADPWLGLGFGYEILGTSETGGGRTPGDGSLTGLEFLNLQGGADFKLADAFSLGPFLSFSLGQYSSETAVGVNGQSQTSDINPKELHEWLTFGVKGTFGI
jgi:hypothetical protein